MVESKFVSLIKNLYYLKNYDDLMCCISILLGFDVIEQFNNFEFKTKQERIIKILD